MTHNNNQPSTANRLANRQGNHLIPLSEIINTPRSPHVMTNRPLDNNEAFEDGLAVKVKIRTKRPARYKVLILNDDFTPMAFVTYVLERVFHKSVAEANAIMLQVHHSGVGIAGVYTYEVAEAKVDQAMGLARKAEHPLQCTMERAE
jgi:ATP-dependent Clp protease adaptor protein ClpS